METRQSRLEGLRRASLRNSTAPCCSECERTANSAEASKSGDVRSGCCLRWQRSSDPGFGNRMLVHHRPLSFSAAAALHQARLSDYRETKLVALGGPVNCAAFSRRWHARYHGVFRHHGKGMGFEGERRASSLSRAIRTRSRLHHLVLMASKS